MSPRLICDCQELAITVVKSVTECLSLYQHELALKLCGSQVPDKILLEKEPKAGTQV